MVKLLKESDVGSGLRGLEKEKESGNILRRSLSFGRLYSNSLLLQKIDINTDHHQDLSRLMDNPKTFRDVREFAVILRELVEWQLWSDRTAFPYVKDQAEPGEPLGQCLVTSRLAQNYFPGSQLVEVQVKQESGEVVGPHVVLELKVDVSGERKGSDMVTYYLDLTSDQSLALGKLSAVTLSNYYAERVNLVEKDSKDNPYVFVRYLNDEDLKDKKSKPLDHSSLLLEMFAYRYRSEKIQGIERFAHDVDIVENLDEVPEPLHSRILEAAEYINNFRLQIKRDAYAPELQIGMISKEDFLPSPEWLWEVSGLRGLSEALLIDHASPQTFYFYVDGKIVIVNLSGTHTEESLRDLTNILTPNQQELRVLYAPSNIFAFQRRRGFTGPLKVR